MGVPLTVQDLNYEYVERFFFLRTKMYVFYATYWPQYIKQTILLLQIMIKRCYDGNIVKLHKLTLKCYILEIDG